MLRRCVEGVMRRSIEGEKKWRVERVCHAPRAQLASSSFAPNGSCSPTTCCTIACTTCMRTPPPNTSTAAIPSAPPAAVNAFVSSALKRCNRSAHNLDRSEGGRKTVGRGRGAMRREARRTR